MQQLFRSGFRGLKSCDSVSKSVQRQLCDINLIYETAVVWHQSVWQPCDTEMHERRDSVQPVRARVPPGTGVLNLSKVHTNGSVDKYMRAALQQPGWFDTFLTGVPIARWLKLVPSPCWCEKFPATWELDLWRIVRKTWSIESSRNNLGQYWKQFCSHHWSFLLTKGMWDNLFVELVETVCYHRHLSY